MSPKTRRLFLWFLSTFFFISIVLILISLYHNFRKPHLRPVPARELRAVWMSRFDYAQSSVSHDQDSIRNYISTALKRAHAAHFNTIFFQVRGNADVLYPSRYEPWSSLLTGNLGENPGWDPLKFTVEKAHELGMEVHAWINVFPAWRGTILPPKTKPLHPLLAHPDWLVCDSSGAPMPYSDHYVSFSPGIPAVQDHILKVIAEIVTNYDIDGIHFDYVRYPEGANRLGYSHDRISVARFRNMRENPQNLGWADWQREQVTTFVARAYDLITNLKPYLKVSAAVIGNYKTSNWNGYHVVYQDARRWVEIGKIDWLIPMIYYGRFEGVNAFPVVIKEWKQTLENIRPFFCGIGAYRLDWQEVLEEIDDVRNNKVGGMVLFAISSLDSTKLSQLRELKFRYPALPPQCPWKNTQPPASPTDFQASLVADTLHFRWQPPAGSSQIRGFVIYRSKSQQIDYKNGENILSFISGKCNTFSLPVKFFESSYYYTITSIDRFGNESAPSISIKI